ncbi:rhodanese-like domain-containing protein [uncultured Paraglaciecola sp.]|jgi:phage shock protein E|uniref:rhodanese-like domain-containing protein n=1 Tax=uncultured Paraglaciecola sp. TaxID=1765024 RepID=UPI0025D6775A|nr:rhodanese-like domain-containing protein [uncultured Paraglaciecola sp.]
MLKTLQLLSQQATQNVQLITAKKAAQDIDKNKGLLIDVREPAEHSASPAVGAINIPRGVLEMKMLEIEKDPERPIYLHCASSLRAVLSAEQLARIGFTNVSVISCKMDEIHKMHQYCD